MLECTDTENTRKSLTFTTRDGEEASFFYPHQISGHISLLVPRYYIQKALPDLPLSRAMPHLSEIKNLIELRETERYPQRTAFAKATDLLDQVGGVTLVVQCGFGKTILALCLLHARGLTAIIVAHKFALLTQWKECIEKCLPGAQVGIICQNRCEVKGRDIVLCSLQSLAARDYGPLQFGVLVSDECHHIPAQTFSKAMSKLDVHYTIGLSATPDRRDGLGQVVFLHMGPKYLVPVVEWRPDVQVNVIKYRTALKMPKMTRSRYSYTRAITVLTRDKRRNQILLDLCRTMTEKPNRKGLFLSCRVAHLQEFYQKLQETKKVALYTGSKNTHPGKNKRTPSFQQNLTFCTFAIASEGLDFDGDYIIISTPSSDVRQCVGRVIRLHSDNRPIVIHMLDEAVDVFCGQFYGKNCHQYYKRAGFEVLFLRV